MPHIAAPIAQIGSMDFAMVTWGYAAAFSAGDVFAGWLLAMPERPLRLVTTDTLAAQQTNADADDVLQGIRQMLAGQAVLPAQLATNLLQEFARLATLPRAPQTPAEDFGLTGRELEVLQFIASGLTDKEIAQRLDLSIYTIKSHVRKILSKLHAANRWEAAQRAREEGLLNE